jgi:hypothetical protein
MSKRIHFQSMAEQIHNNGHASAPFHRDPYQTSEIMKSNYVQTKTSVDDSEKQLSDFQIFQEKGGFGLENWLEAERILNNNP